MNKESYPNPWQCVWLFFRIIIIFGMFLFLTLTLPQFFNIQLSPVYYSIISTIAPFLWIPIILFVQKESGMKLNLSLDFPHLRTVILLIILVISTKIITNPLYNITVSIKYLIEGRLKIDNLELLEFNFSLIVRFIGLVFVVPIFEEIFWRRQILVLFLNKYSPSFAVVLSSLLFAIGHLKFNSIIALLIWGLLFGIIYYQTQSLGATIFAHSLCNFLDFFTKHEFIYLTTSNIIINFLCFISSLASLFFIIRYLDHQRKKIANEQT